MTTEETLAKITSVLEDKKAFDIKSYDLRDIPNAITDIAIVATANSPPHLKALAGSVQREMRKAGSGAARTSGDSESAWIVIDYGDVMAHLFLAEAREYYEIEALFVPPAPKESPAVSTKPPVTKKSATGTANKATASRRTPKTAEKKATSAPKSRKSPTPN